MALSAFIDAETLCVRYMYKGAEFGYDNRIGVGACDHGPSGLRRQGSVSESAVRNAS